MHVRFWPRAFVQALGRGGGVGGWGEGGMMTTLVHRHPEQYLHESCVSRYLQYFRDVGPSYIVTQHIPHVPLQLCLAVPVEARLRLRKQLANVY